MGVLVQVDGNSWRLCKRGLWWRKSSSGDWVRSGATPDTLRDILYQATKEARQHQYDRARRNTKVSVLPSFLD